jgi:hypothetical protein
MSEDFYRLTRNDLLSNETRFDEICETSNLSSDVRDCIISWKLFLAANKQIDTDSQFWVRPAYFYAFSRGYYNGILDASDLDWE